MNCKYLIMYDISHNRFRTRLAKKLQKSGFYRIQRSVYIGKTTTELLQKIIDYVTQHRIQQQKKQPHYRDSFILIPLTASLIDKMEELNRPMDFTFFVGEKNVVIV